MLHHFTAQFCFVAALLLTGPAGAQTAPTRADAALERRIAALLQRAPVVDGHNDLAWELREGHSARVEAVDLASDTRRLDPPLQTDLPRLRAGGVGAQFWSVWIPATITGPAAVETTLEQIDIVRRIAGANPERLELASSVADVRRISRAGRVASLMGVEGGHQIDGRLSVLRQYRALGVGYMTLTHGKSVGWADSATDAPQTADGLTDFGRQVVREMNRIGMIVDVSHVSDATMRAVLATSTAPVIASHSGARAVADAPRNVPDDLLRAIAANGGVVMVNVFPAFLSDAWRRWDVERTAFAKARALPADLYGQRTPEGLRGWDRANPEPRVTTATVADHVEHIARAAGRDHVGLGGDYDGISGTAPADMTGVDGYPVLFRELARRGWNDADLARLSQGNILRVMERVEAVSRSLTAMPPIDASWGSDAPGRTAAPSTPPPPTGSKLPEPRS